MIAGPIISGGNPRLEALLAIALLVLLALVMIPEFGSMVLEKLPWLAPLFHWSLHILDSH